MLENQENAVVLRFGRVNEVVTDPGLHFKVPLVDQIEKVDVRAIYNMEYGFRTDTPGTEKLLQYIQKKKRKLELSLMVPTIMHPLP